MSRWEFMRQLEELLSDISPSEREEALQYYNDYFNDAGRENEQEVIQALGSPSQVAQIVKDGLGENAGAGEFTENGFALEKVQAASGEQKETGAKKETGAQLQKKTSQKEQKKDPLPGWAIVLLVIGGIFLSPVILGIAGSAIGIIFSIFMAVIGLVIGLGAAALALYITAIVLVVVGIGIFLESPAAAIGTIGAAFICAAFGVLFMILTVLLVGKLIPAICQGTGYIFRKIFGKKEVA